MISTYGFCKYSDCIIRKIILKVALELQIKPLRHILNTSGISNFENAQYDMVRLGMDCTVSNDAEEQLEMWGR
jgi:alanine racemase